MGCNFKSIEDTKVSVLFISEEWGLVGGIQKVVKLCEKVFVVLCVLKRGL
ncbi:hypothetical protein CALK_0664 [Chitinivibrio alkaliphilus ACht1]|uniref:Uncharacterized protein n=1 Tax=Chitinivibrio alkaliphilus ACht1 TaxID=1313304 RepID=U7DDC5_9BACT|nr:hypothetical protein CALK_0664 [Chitinivibrio alkaliphilus ACht1]